MKRLEQASIRRLNGAWKEVGDCLPILRNTIDMTDESNLPDFRGRLSLIVHSVATAAYEMQKLIQDYGGARDH